MKTRMILSGLGLILGLCINAQAELPCSFENIKVCPEGQIDGCQNHTTQVHQCVPKQGGAGGGGLSCAFENIKVCSSMRPRDQRLWRRRVALLVRKYQILPGRSDRWLPEPHDASSPMRSGLWLSVSIRSDGGGRSFRGWAEVKFRQRRAFSALLFSGFVCNLLNDAEKSGY
jgi:hypothetical protein